MSQFRSSHRVWSIKKVFQACNFIKKETPTQVLSCEFCENFENTFLKKHLRVTASVYSNFWNVQYYIISFNCQEISSSYLNLLNLHPLSMDVWFELTELKLLLRFLGVIRWHLGSREKHWKSADRKLATLLKREFGR